MKLTIFFASLIVSFFSCGTTAQSQTDTAISSNVFPRLEKLLIANFGLKDGKQFACSLAKDLVKGKYNRIIDITEYELDTPAAQAKPKLLLSEIFQAVFNDPKILLVEEVDELKYLPFVNQDSHLLVITGKDDILTEKRSRALEATAKRRNIRISTVWTGSTSSPQAMQHLSYLSQKLNGNLFILDPRSMTSCS